MKTRRVLATVVPARNTTFEQEVFCFVPPEIYAINSRAETKYSLNWRSDDQMKAMAAAIQAGEPDALARLAAAEPDLAVIGETSTFESVEDFENRKKEYAGIIGCPVILWPESYLAAFKALDITKTVAVAGPRKRSSGNHISKHIFERWGVETVAVDGFDCQSAADIAAIKYDDMADVMKRLKDTESEAICLFGTNIAAMAHVDALEKITGRPVLHINTVLIWHALNVLQIDSKRKDLGRLVSA